MNSNHKVNANVPLEALISNFSHLLVAMAKGKFVVYASRSPLALIIMEVGVAQDLYGVYSIFRTTNDDDKGSTKPSCSDWTQCNDEKEVEGTQRKVPVFDGKPEDTLVPTKEAKDPISVEDMHLVMDMKK